MKENIRKIKKSAICGGPHSAVKRGRAHRFSKWCAERYNISWRGVYENLRHTDPLRWKWEGMDSCVKEFCPEHNGTLREFWNGCKKNHFVEFMKDKDICRMTLWKKFNDDQWTELERKGIRSMYRYWLENVEPKN